MKKISRFALSITILLCTTDSISAQSPYKISWEKDGYILGVGSTTTLTGFLLYRSVSSPTPTEVNQLSRTSVNSLDRSATYRFSETADKTSDILYGIAACAPIILLTDHRIKNDWRTIALMYIETWSFIGSTSMLSKGLVKRFRPYVYHPNVSLDKKLSSDAKMSFFSNHTTTAFASAVFISTVYSDYYPRSEWKPYIWTGSLLTASFIGYLRYEAGMHFPTDILVGAMIGSAIGYVIPWIHRVNNDDISLTPDALYADYGFSVQVKF
jgi:membrane-associated phospholipid phosphatase